MSSLRSALLDHKEQKSDREVQTGWTKNIGQISSDSELLSQTTHIV